MNCQFLFAFSNEKMLERVTIANVEMLSGKTHTVAKIN